MGTQSRGSGTYTMNNQTIQVSVIIPTYNESENIVKLIEDGKNLPTIRTASEIIVVDDNSPDKNGEAVEAYIQKADLNNTIGAPIQLLQIRPMPIKIIHRSGKTGLIPAFLDGIRSSTGENIIVMDADFSHPLNYYGLFFSFFLVFLSYCFILDLFIAALRQHKEAILATEEYLRVVIDGFIDKMAEFTTIINACHF